MEQFGRLAVVVTALLLISGGFMLTRLLESFGELTGTAYGQSMLLKLSAVAGLLSLGALNKFFLVPGLCNANGVRRLKRSIVLEMTIASLILVVTAY